MEKTKLKILKMLQEKKAIKPRDIIDSFITQNSKDAMKAEATLRSMVANGVVILNKHRKIVMPKLNKPLKK
jgi:hypothetical protein